MNDSDIEKLRELIYDIRKNVKKENDWGIESQCATYNYVINSKDVNIWANDTIIGNKLLEDLKKQNMRLNEFSKLTLKFVDNMEQYLNLQSKINKGNNL